MNLFEIPNERTFGPPVRMVAPRISRTPRSHERFAYLYAKPLETFPNFFLPENKAEELNRYLKDPRSVYRDPDDKKRAHEPFGNLATTSHPRVAELKKMVVDLPPIVSLEARAFLLMDAVNQHHPEVIDPSRGFPFFYDSGYDRYMAKYVYGGNGLYDAFQEWIQLKDGRHQAVKGKHPEIEWMDMDIRHTLLAYPIFQPVGEPSVKELFKTRAVTSRHLAHHFKHPQDETAEYLVKIAPKIDASLARLTHLNLLPIRSDVLVVA